MDKNTNIWLNLEQYTKLKEFRYLGSPISSGGEWKIDNCFQIVFVKQAFSKKKSLLTSKLTSLKVKKHIIKILLLNSAQDKKRKITSVVVRPN